ncbi:MAG: (2Fe-2S)-binding protein [Cyclobacteriaceae bacterium]|jgi:aerobic-type carbon monoxide dehydrogenase small subunit (CoxS/CutS family)|nr:(2Fe-2S)-binding protein [Cyclobacteriaceae bacterium]
MQLRVNNQDYEIDVNGNTPLLNTLREHLKLTGSKYGCGEGVCGACTVLINGVPVRSCITPVGSTQNKEITTIEGLEQEGKLHSVQAAFLETDPFQCAYCASGMILSTVALLKRNPTPSRQEIVEAMQGNICRCGTYPALLEAIQVAVKK